MARQQAKAIDSSATSTQTQSSNSAVGLSFGASTGVGGGVGANLTVAANRSSGYTNGWGTTYWQTQLAAGQKLNLDAGQDLTLNDAKASGLSVM
ncbi:hemagglutinin repeat-containing protein [Paucibacter sp. APW11]|uniref:Hemagglutinin repeat-containing protein n=1 Tax=Roseateles aquae TaxID=3077235 RepID=A0ABU3PDD9_9BURK|nr:hemagglutinin repeat-containing protein [Paucibacter sp. APW11]MDT9000565.1 hemagglutinin repeat-containing protein [Paucibacter sp. APW11]